MRLTEVDGDVSFIDTSNTMDIVRLRLRRQERESKTGLIHESVDLVVVVDHEN